MACPQARQFCKPVHRGTGTAAGAWMARREALVRGGFAFEYSATFGQAVAKGRTSAEEEEEMKKEVEAIKAEVKTDKENIDKKA